MCSPDGITLRRFRFDVTFSFFRNIDEIVAKGCKLVLRDHMASASGGVLVKVLSKGASSFGYWSRLSIAH